MTTLSMVIGAAAPAPYVRGRGEENRINKGLDRVLFRKNVEGFCSSRVIRSKHKPKFSVAAMVTKNVNENDDDDDPLWPDPDDIGPNGDTPLNKYLSYFHDLKDEVREPTFSFEKPFYDSFANIFKLRRAVEQSGLDYGDQVKRLKSKLNEALDGLDTHLTQNQHMAIARYPNRPDVVDCIMNTAETWVELHGGRTGYDPAIVTGLGSIQGEIYMFIGHQRKRKLKLAEPTPRSYKQALLMMKYAEHYGFPIVIFVDTTSTFPDLKSEELSQEEAIAHNLRTMFSLKVPIVTIVTGEGGPGGALAIACANKLLMMEMSAFYVASPDAGAEILQQLSPAARKSAEKRAKKANITAQEHYRLRIEGGLIWESVTGPWCEEIKSSLLKVMEELRILDSDELVRQRMLKFPTIGQGGYKNEDDGMRTKKKHRMKPSEAGFNIFSFQHFLTPKKKNGGLVLLLWLGFRYLICFDYEIVRHKDPVDPHRASNSIAGTLLVARDMATLSIVIGTAAPCARGRGEENRIFGGLSDKGSDRVLLRKNVEEFCSSRVMRNKHNSKFSVAAAMVKKNENENDDDDPLWPDPDDFDPSRDTPLTKYLSSFDRRSNTDFSFYKPFNDLNESISQLHLAVHRSGLDFLHQVDRLGWKSIEAFEHFHSHLTQNQRLAIARHPNRPDVVDCIKSIAGTWVELHGDRTCYDPAIVTGLGSIQGEIYMFIGHQRNRKLKSAVPTPRSYKKALLMMKYAERYGFPIVIFVDTTSAFPDLKSEELSQEEAIAHNLRTMFSLKVPIVTIVTGEGGPGGALAIACANKLLMMQRSAFYVASPDAGAEILQQLSPAARKSAEKRAKKVNITAQEHYRLRIEGGLILEPADCPWSEYIQSALLKVMEELRVLDRDELVQHRMLKFPTIGQGGYQNEDGRMQTKKKHRMKPSEVKILKTAEIECQLEQLTKKILKAEGTFNPKETE
ncbi:OLC1v1004032C1 [Oldenlandia corymbosa var. corymbosa]|uniref:acetyl-CoA carboxytransferase n=1 Tax=Oldenlandia corymbosa var. corymbosa TaxID=529605 RepID=A0AAV1DBL4_OLDCO|nr:OLC1v1004032C1 [Oldenlandia corymbosa var. corymbosa]